MKNYLIGIILLVLAFFLLWRQGAQQMDLARQDANRTAPVEPAYSAADQNVTISNPTVVPESNATPVLPIEKPVVLGLEQNVTALETAYSSLVFFNDGIFFNINI